MIRLRRLFSFSLILFIIQVDGVQIGAKPPLLVCHIPLELKIFADSSYQASSADLKSCTQITLSSVNVLFLTNSNASLTAVMVSEKRSLQLMKQQTPEAAFSFSLRSTNVFPATRHLKTIFNGTTSVALLIEFLKVNKLTGFDIAWDLIQSTPDYAPMLKTLKASLTKEGFNLTTTIGNEVDRTDAFHVSKIAAIVDHIFLVPSYNRHYSGAQYPLVDKNLEQAFDSLELNEGVFLKLYSTLKLSWTKIVVGLSLQTLLWKLNAGTTLTGSQFNQTQAVLQLQSYYESCKNVSLTWRIQKQPNPFYKLAVAPTNDKWMIHVDPFTLGRRVDLLRQYGFGGVALYDYYQDDFAGVCNANAKVYPLIHQAGLSMFNSSTKIPFPEIDSNSGLCIPFLGLTNECKGIFNFGTPKLNISSTDLTSSTISSSFAVKKTKVPVQTDPTTIVMTSLSSSSTTTPTPVSDAEYLDQTRWSSVSSESLSTEPSLSYVNLHGLASTEIKLDFPSTYSSEIKLPVAESLVTTSVSVNAATGGFLGKDEIWRDDQTHLSGVTETALNQNDGSSVAAAFNQHIQQSTSPNTVIDTVPTTSLPEIRIGNRINPGSASTMLLSTALPKLAVESEVTAVEQSALPISEIERATDFAIVPTIIPSFEASVVTSIQVDTEPTSSYDSTGSKSISEMTTVSSNSASVHETFTDTIPFASTEGDIQNFTDDKSSVKEASDVTSSVTENVSVSSTKQSSLVLEKNENTAAPAETDSIATTRTPTFGNQQPSSQYSGSVGDSMKETTTELPSSPSVTRQDWTSPIPSSVAFEHFPIDNVMESLYGEFALTSEEPQTNDAFSSEMTSAGYQGTVPTVPPSSTPNEQFTIREISSVSEEISMESHIFSDGFPSTIEVIPPLILTTAQDTSTGLLIEHGNLDSASSMASIEGTQFPTDFQLSTPSAPIGEDVSNTNYNPVSVATTDPPPEKFPLPVELSVPESSSKPVSPTEDPAFSSTLQHASAFDSTDAYFPTEQFSTSSRPLVSSTNSPLFSEFETESGEQTNDVSTLTPIFENEASEDSMSTLGESENVTPGYLNATDQPATSISEISSSQGYSNEHFTNVDTTPAEISDIESSVVSDGLYPTAGIPSILESSTETELHLSSTSDSSAVSTTVQPVEPTENNLSSASSMPYKLEASIIPTEIQDLSQYSSTEVPVGDLLSFDAATSGNFSSDLFSPTFESTTHVDQESSSTFSIPNVMDSSTQEQLQDFSSPNSLTSTEETDSDNSLSTTTTPPIMLDASTMVTKLVSDENSILFSTINFSWEISQSEITSPLPDESKIQQSFDGALKPTENESASPREQDFFSTSFYVPSSSVTIDPSFTSSFQSIDTSTEPHDDSASVSTNSPLLSEFEMGSGDESINLPTLLPIFENEESGEDPTATVEEAENVTPGFLNATDQPVAIQQSVEKTSPENQDQLFSLSPEDSSNHQTAISALPSEFAETSPEGSGFQPTLLPNLVDIASTFIIPDIIEASTERLSSSPTGNSAVSPQDDNLSTAVWSVDVSAADSQLVSSEIYQTTSPSIVDLPIKETASSFIPLVTDGNGYGSGDSTPFFDTLKPTENESPREEDSFSSVEADYSTLSYVFSEQTATTLPSSSSVTAISSVTSSFQSIDTSTKLHSASTSFSSGLEMGSGHESIDVPTEIPIFENEESGEDPTATVEEAENVTPGFLNATDQPVAIQQSVEKTSPENQDQLFSLSPEDSSNHQTAISALPSEFAETSPEGSGFQPTLLPNLVDIASAFIIPDIIEASTERLPSSLTGNSGADVSDADSQLVSREIYPTTSSSIVDLPIKETASASSFIPLVTDENGYGSGDSTPFFDTLKPTENESPREEDSFSSVEADYSTLSYVSSEQTATTLPSSSSVKAVSSVTSSFQSIDTSTELHSASTSFSSGLEMGSGDESIDVPTEIPIFENEESGEDSTSTLEAEAATDQPTINISKIDSTINPFSSSLADNVSESLSRYTVTTTVSIESTSPRAMIDDSFVEELEEISSTKVATIISESLSLVSSSPDSSTKIPFLSSTPPTVSDIPSEPSTSQSTFSQSSTSLSSQSFTPKVDAVSSVAFSDANTITSSTAAWSGSFGSSSASTESTSSSSTSTISITTSNTPHSDISTDKWVKTSDATTEVLSATESTTISSSNFTTSLSASTISHSTSSLSSSVEPASTTVKSHSTTPPFQTTKSSLPHSEIPTTTTDPLSNLWNLLISKLNETISFPNSGEYSYVSSFFWSNTTSSNLTSESIQEIPAPSISSPSVNTGNWLFETRPFWLFDLPNTEAPSSLSTATLSTPKETKQTLLPVSPTTSNSLEISTSTPIADLFETRPFWLQRSTQLTKSTLSSTPSITTSSESSSTSTSSTKALHTSDSEMSSTTTVTPPSTATSLSAQQSTSFNPNVSRRPCTDNCTEESTGNSSVVFVAKDVANNVVLNLNVDAYMGDKRLNSSFNFEKWLEDLHRFLSSPSKPQTEEIKPSPICELAGNSILLKSLFCPDDSLSTADKIRFPNLMNLTRLLAPAIIANLTTSLNLTEVVAGNGTEFLNHQSNISSETSTESTVSTSTESSTSIFHSQNVSTTLVTSNLSDVPLPTVLNSSLESFMLAMRNLTELLKDSKMSDLISAVNNLNHSVPEGFLESLIQSNNSDDGRFFNKSPLKNDVIDAVTTQAPTSTFSATPSTTVQHDIFAKNFWKANKRNPVRKLQRVAGPGLGIIPSIRLPLRTKVKPVSNIFSSLAKPAASRQ